MRFITILVLFLIIIAYLSIGAVIFMVLENGHNEDMKVKSVQLFEDFVANFSCVPEKELRELIRSLITAHHQGVSMSRNTSNEAQSIWNFHNSLFFSMTVISTIGYGNQTPSTTGGRLFVVFYALIGIPIFGVLLAGIGEKLSIPVKRFKNRTFCTQFPRFERIFKSVVISLSGMSVFTLIPAAIFSHVEGWTYSDSVYYAVVTLSTIGFGDFVIGMDSMDNQAFYKIMVIVWIFIGLAWLAFVLGEASELHKQRTKRAEKKISNRMKASKEKSKSDKLKNEKMESNNNASQGVEIVESTHL